MREGRYNNEYQEIKEKDLDFRSGLHFLEAYRLNYVEWIFLHCPDRASGS